MIPRQSGGSYAQSAVAASLGNGLINQIAWLETDLAAAHAVAADTTNGTFWHKKIALPVKNPEDVIGLKLFYCNHDTGSAVTIAAVVGATETAMTDTDNNRYKVVKDGDAATYNVYNSATDVYGWFPILWAAASSVAVNVPTSSLDPAFTVSDFLPIVLIPRAAGDTTAGSYTKWPLLMIRARFTAVGTRNISYKVAAVAANVQSATDNNRGLITQSYRTSNAGNSTFISAPDSNTPSGALVEASMSMGVILYLKNGGISILAFGDSTTSAGSIADGVMGGYEGPGTVAAALVAESGTPCGYVNRGAPSQQANIWAAAVATTVAAVPGNVVVHQVLTHNSGGGLTTAALARVKCKEWGKYISDVYGYIAAAGLAINKAARLFLCTGTPDPTNVTTAAADAVRIAWINNLRQGRIAPTIVDTAALFKDTGGASPESWNQQYGAAIGTAVPLTSISAGAPGVCTKTAHGYVTGTVGRLTTSGTLPTGLALATYYFVNRIDADTFSLSLTNGGTGITTSDTGTGTHSFNPIDYIHEGPAGVRAWGSLLRSRIREVFGV